MEATSSLVKDLQNKINLTKVFKPPYGLKYLENSKNMLDFQSMFKYTLSIRNFFKFEFLYLKSCIKNLKAMIKSQNL